MIKHTLYGIGAIIAGILLFVLVLDLTAVNFLYNQIFRFIIILAWLSIDILCIGLGVKQFIKAYRLRNYRK